MSSIYSGPYFRPVRFVAVGSQVFSTGTAAVKIRLYIRFTQRQPGGATF
jgi:hypothetical protein